MSDLERAIAICVEAHRGQRQKDGLPYALHPLALAQAVGPVKAKIAAVLHDVVEDTDWTLAALEAEGFAPAVIRALALLTHDDGSPYPDYVERIARNALAREVKLADLEHNMDLRRIPSPTARDLERLAKYRAAWEVLSRARDAARGPGPHEVAEPISSR